MLSLSSFSHAAVVNFDSLRLDTTATDNGSVSDGVNTGSTITSTLGNGTASYTVTYAVSGLDLDGIGGADDSLSVTLAVDATGGVVNAGGGGTPLGVESTGETTGQTQQINQFGESLEFSFDSATATLGNGGAATVSFDGFSELNFQTGAGGFGFGPADRYDLSGTSADGTGVDANFNPTADSVSFDPTSSFEVGYSNGATGDGFRIFSTDFAVTVTPVPEPSTAVFSLFAVMGFILRRRR